MQLKEFYESLGGSYQDVKSRLMNDAFILRLTFKFLDDKSFEKLSLAMERKDYGEAFCMVHTLKGVCLNLGFDCLSHSAGALTEELRKWDTRPVDEDKCIQLFKQVSADYKSVTDAIVSLKETNG